MKKRRSAFDDSGQVDGDAVSSPALIAPSTQWLPTGTPPWHLWGNTQLVDLGVVGATPVQQLAQQLARVSYHRPESWHWLFSAVIKSAPTAALGQSGIVFVAFDLIIGIGRGNIIIPSFELYSWEWVGPSLAPVGRQTWSTQVNAPNRVFVTPTPATPVANVVDQFVAQDVQLSARVIAQMFGGLSGAVSVEVSGQLAPKTHLRPDWFGDGPGPERFSGSELAGT